MIEAYAFLAMFTVQILALSVVYPAWFIRYLRQQANSIPIERLAQLYPGVDHGRARERFLTRYRMLNTAIAVLGALLLGWLYSYLRRPDWGNGPVEVLVSVYFLVQVFLPLGLVAWRAVRFNRMRGSSLLQGKRQAVLQRRGLFDFVSPWVVSLAAVSYALFAAFVLYVQQDPFPGFSALVNLGVITVVYAIQASIVYAVLYGKKTNPFAAHADRMRTIGLVVKSSVYSCSACVAFLSLNCMIGLLDLRRWEPFALSVFFVITALLSLMGLSALPRPPQANGHGSGGQPTPERAPG